jgi:hypothetical protein
VNTLNSKRKTQRKGSSVRAKKNRKKRKEETERERESKSAQRFVFRQRAHNRKKIVK